MATIQFDDVSFRALFAAFANTTTYPTPTLQLYWNAATDYVNATTPMAVMPLATQTLALNQMTAHITQLMAMAASGQSGGIVQGSTIDKISVTLVPPLVPNGWRFWLNQTQYGQQLLALLEVNAVGGFFAIGARPFRIH